MQQETNTAVNENEHVTLAQQVKVWLVGVVLSVFLIVIVICHFDTKSQVESQAEQANTRLQAAIKSSEQLQDLKVSAQAAVEQKLMQESIQDVNRKLERLADVLDEPKHAEKKATGDDIKGTSVMISNNNGIRQTIGGHK
ncbi:MULTISPECIES: hypothetical protein [unclassified Pseudomonas]|uniref:hypothetical protein n=1 Tax=unclassified Pseudomonas TaxID=196821 RepID=UPI002248BB8B|nr:hypothetical protein [Pseudomonas sp. DCB_BG]MCX2708365.1 hypothetical protein [Pseudomonas sp. DCB_BG]